MYSYFKSLIISFFVLMLSACNTETHVEYEPIPPITGQEAIDLFVSKYDLLASEVEEMCHTYECLVESGNYKVRANDRVFIVDSLQVVAYVDFPLAGEGVSPPKFLHTSIGDRHNATHIATSQANNTITSSIHVSLNNQDFEDSVYMESMPTLSVSVEKDGSTFISRSSLYWTKSHDNGVFGTVLDIMMLSSSI